MRTFLISILVFIFSFNSFSAVTVQGPIIPTVTIGGVTLPLSQAVVLTCMTQSATDYVTMRRANVQYQVPAGKKLVIVAIQGINSSTALGAAGLGYADTATTSAQPTNNIALLGAGSVSWWFITAGNGTTNNGLALYHEIPSGKFPYMLGQSAVNQTFTILGYLQ